MSTSIQEPPLSPPHDPSFPLSQPLADAENSEVTSHSLLTIPSNSSLSLIRVHANVMEDATPTPTPTTTVPELSRFETIISTCEPVLNSLLANLPTASIFKLYCSSKFLREFLGDYPLAFRTLSFRLPQQALMMGSPGNELADGQESQQYSLDLVLKRVVMPVSPLLTNLDLCNTSIYGVTLVGSVLHHRGHTLKHLSVRGCKNVSLKYHIVPFLRTYEQELQMYPKSKLALESLYTYRCRHHRRRPYLPISLTRRDSDSEPTHELIRLCHALGIWTDTAWCPTPGPRCLRRKDYHGNRGGPGHNDVWVPFDRLWRSSNRIGPSHDERGKPVGKLWEEIECGHDGEPLGLGDGTFPGEGKDVPAHKRQSHKVFVDEIKCDDCGDSIAERCETCSIKMHCMGCRKTLCANCAFNRPYSKKKNSDTTTQPPSSESTTKKNGNNDLWWAPGATTSPNSMIDSLDHDNDDNNGQFHAQPLKLALQWCCLEPLFSGGGGVAFVGPGLGGTGSERIRAVPLPRQKQYIDSDFVATPSDGLSEDGFAQNVRKFENMMGSAIDILPYLQQTQSEMDLQAETCPRSLCKTCYDKTFAWRVSCRACKRPICKEHDFRALKVRKCGFRDLGEEREYVLNPPEEAREVLRRNDMAVAAATAAQGLAGVDQEVDESGKEWPRNLIIPAFRRTRTTANRIISDSESTASSSTNNVNSGSSSDEDRRSRGRTARSSDEMGSDADSTADGPGTRDPSSAPVGSLRVALASASGERAASVAPGSGDAYAHQDDDYSLIASYETETPSSNGTFIAAPVTPRTNAAVNTFGNISGLLPRRARSVSMSDLLSPSPSPSTSRSPAAHNINSHNINTLKNKNRYQNSASQHQHLIGGGIAIPKEKLLLPGHGKHPVQWRGCGAYFCQSVRPMGDNRGRCSSNGKECHECSVFVCEACLPPAKTCPCNFCAQTFHCEDCLTKASVRSSCQREADRQRELKRQAEIKETQEKLAAMGGGFWELLVGKGYVDDVAKDETIVEGIEDVQGAEDDIPEGEVLARIQDELLNGTDEDVDTGMVFVE